MFNNCKKRVIAIAAGTLALTTAGSAKAVTFDFESTPTTTTPAAETGALTTLTTTSGTLSLTLTRAGGAKFDVSNNAGFSFPASFGSRSLDPFISINNAANFFVGDFASPVSQVQVSFGDYDSDEDMVTLATYSGPNGTGSVLGTSTVDYPLASDFSINNNFGTVATTGGSIQSFTLSSAGSFPNSLYYDNITATASVPEPTSIGLLGLGAVGLLGRRRHASAK